MADNVQTQSTTPATIPDATVIGSAEASFSGDTVQVPIGALVEITGPEGSRSAALVSPATSGKQDTANTSLASIDGKIVAGALTESDFDTKIGALTESAPATDTASSGLNGRLQRIAQRLTSLISVIGSPFQAGGSIGNTSFASTIADGADVTLGSKADAKSTATDSTAITIMQVLKQISASVQLFVFGAGTAAAAQRTTLASDDPAVSVLGATTGSKVITDANGTIQQYLRGLIYLLITSANYPEKAIYGSTTTVISTAVDVAAGNFSATTTTFDNTNDATVPYARWAKAVASFPDWAAAPVAGTTVDLYGLLIDVDGTSDDTQAPSGTAQGGARYFGSFIISADDALQRRTITIDLLGVEKVDFYFKNGTAQNMNNDAGTSAIVKITPFSYGVAI